MLSKCIKGARLGPQIVRATRLNSTLGVWSDFSKRPASLKICDQDIRKGVFNKISETEGPESITIQERRATYHSPVEIDETFSLAYDLLQKDSNELYQQVDKLNEKINQTTSQQEKNQLINERDQLLVDAEIKNPEVLYNSEYESSETLDRTHPVYRALLKKKWESHGLMVTMQRLEQLHVIPDTLPTLEPSADIQVKFPHNTMSQFSSWIVPGTVLPTKVVNQPPTIKIDQFENVENSGLYSVLLVNPDTPDLTTNSFSTTLHYGLANVSLSNSDNVIDSKKLLEVGDEITFKPYVPLTPEVNAQNQRACLWVFKQNSMLDIKQVECDHFDIRKFVEQHQLTPIGGHVWRQCYDRHVNETREKYGLGKGNVYHRVRKDRPMA
jgi:large subunit ribosomal protein L35